MEDLILVKPNEEYIDEIRAYRQAFIDINDHLHGVGSLRRFENPQDWIDDCRLLEHAETVPNPEYVEAEEFMLVRRYDDEHRILGTINFRHYLNEHLAEYGGHIGYSIRPTERRKGYATQMLRLCLDRCRAFGLAKVLITCSVDNEGSKRTILSCGGVFERNTGADEDGEILERYWIDLCHETLYISDLDGTLLNPNAELSDFTKQALDTLIANGLCFSVATARTWASVEKILADTVLPVPLVLMNGVVIYDMAMKEYVKIHRIAPEVVGQVAATLKKLNVTGFMYELKNDFQTTYYEALETKPLYDFVHERVTKYKKAFQQVNNFENVPFDDIIYFTLLDTQKKLKPVYDELLKIGGLTIEFYKDIYNADMWFLEIFSGIASKRNAILFLKERYGYKNIVGFGDNLNDLPLFEACDHCYAVANAREAVKAAADGVIGSNVDDGVAHWLTENSGGIAGDV
jgi:Cof subfamily protein (haloacid dehalogenase superfamily)